MFRFLSADWLPWIALLGSRERWLELLFKLMPSDWQTICQRYRPTSFRDQIHVYPTGFIPQVRLAA